MIKTLFEKYIDFSLPKHKHIAKALKDVKDFDKALAIVAKSLFLTDQLIATLRAEAKDFSKDDAENVLKSKEEDEARQLKAEEELEKIKKENEEANSTGRRQGETTYS